MINRQTLGLLLGFACLGLMIVVVRPAVGPLKAEQETSTQPGNAPAREEVIRNRLADERVESLTRGLPLWVKEYFLALENGYLEGYGGGYSRIFAWGTGTYQGQTFSWIGWSNSAGALRMEVGLTLLPHDLQRMRGVSAKLIPGHGMPSLHIEPKTGFHWAKEFCLERDAYVCDTNAAFDKYLLPAANAALPGLTFTVQGRFPL